MEGRAGVSQLVNESEGSRLWRGGRVIVGGFSRSRGVRSGYRQDEWGQCETVYQSHI